MGMAALDLSGEVTEFTGEPIAAGRAWLGKDLAEGDWQVNLSAEAVGEIRSMASKIEQQPLPTVLRRVGEFECPQLLAAVSKARKMLDDGCGFTVLDRLPMDEFDIDLMLTVFWVIGEKLGTQVAQKWDGTMLYDVTDTGKKWGYGVRGSATNVELVFHVDNAFGPVVPDYVGLLCKYPAVEGGLSRFCSLYTLHNRLLEEVPHLLKRLYQPMFYDRQAEHGDGAPKTSWAPFFGWDGQRIRSRANVQLVRKGYDVAGQDMDDQLAEALAAVERISRSDDLWYEASIERGQIQYLNNQNLGHYRSEFQDNPDPAFKRHLFRTWHRSSGLRTYEGV